MGVLESNSRLRIRINNKTFQKLQIYQESKLPVCVEINQGMLEMFLIKLKNRADEFSNESSTVLRGQICKYTDSKRFSIVTT